MAGLPRRRAKHSIDAMFLVFGANDAMDSLPSTSPLLRR